MTQNDISNWKKTDPDNFQFGREIRGGVYQFKEFNRNEYSGTYLELKRFYVGSELDEALAKDWDSQWYWIDAEINLSDYSEPEIENYISAYYSDLDELKEIYGDDWMWIAAECIFEQQSGLY